MQKELLQIICNYLDPVSYYEITNAYNVSIDNYMRCIDINIGCSPDLPIGGNHKITDVFIKRGFINDADVIDYALEYDIPDYVVLSCINNKFYVTHNTCVERAIPQICNIPKIITKSYKEYGLRLPAEYLSVIFEQNCIELMLLVQNYPEKSNMSIEGYKRIHNSLWKLNYKHKFAHILSIGNNACFPFLMFMFVFVCAIYTFPFIVAQMPDNGWIYVFTPVYIITICCMLQYATNTYSTMLEKKLPL